jgi:hypothetical protein
MRSLVHAVRVRLVSHDLTAPQRLGGARPTDRLAKLNEVEA